MLLGTLSLLATLARAAVPDVGWPVEEEPAPVTWGATNAVYVVTIPPEGPLRVELTWRFAALDPAWMDVPLAGRALVVDSVTGPAIAGPYGLRALLPPSARTATVTVTGTLDPTRPGAASLPVLAAARQHVIVDAPGLDVTIAGATDGWLAAANTLTLTWKPHVEAAPTAQAPIVNAEASTAVWAEPGALLARAAVRWRVVRGEVGRFELDVTGLEEVEVEGPNLARAVREGNRMVLTARAPVRGTFVVDVRARRPLDGDAEVDAPAPRPIAARVERYWTVGRAEDGELVPSGGPRAVPARTLPEWARGLSDTPPESFWQGDSPLRVRVARFTPLMGPDTVIERAELVVAAAAEGRALVRTTWHTRNERRQYLHVRPPPGLRPMTARVSGEPVSVLSDGAGGVYVPLEKSVETVQGLLTFPVELTWIAEGEEWAKKGERVLSLPAVDAPIQAADWEVYLPRGWTAKGASAATPPPVVTEADEALQQAVVAYKNNKFEEAQGLLEFSRAAGSTSSNIDRLQSNLDVLLDKDAKADEVEDGASRRVRELANAKTVTKQVEQEKATESARRAYESGDVDEAERYLEEVIALADDIGVTEQKESAEQSGKKEEAKKLLDEVVASKAKRKADSSAWRSQVESGTADGPNAAPPAVTVTAPPPETGGYVADDDARDARDGDGLGGLGTHGYGRGGGGAGAGEGEGEEATVEVDEENVVTTTATTRVLSSVPGVAKRGGASRRDAKPKPAVKTPDRDADGIRDQVDTSTGDDAPAAQAPRDINLESVDIEGELDVPRVPIADPAAALPVEAPPEPARRAALEVKAAPLTLAMPLGGDVVRSTAALLPADVHPTLTVPYRTLSSRDGASR
ncbi:MAG: hypothetical protein Q8P41_08740 [Pseudomonadota bacterium]|nr:hypothetical protein [Pseudomonadota bacterium]